jgi:hypothetical protein
MGSNIRRQGSGSRRGWSARFDVKSALFLGALVLEERVFPQPGRHSGLVNRAHRQPGYGENFSLAACLSPCLVTSLPCPGTRGRPQSQAARHKQEIGGETSAGPPSRLQTGQQRASLLRKSPCSAASSQAKLPRLPLAYSLPGEPIPGASYPYWRAAGRISSHRAACNLPPATASRP